MADPFALLSPRHQKFHGLPRKWLIGDAALHRYSLHAAVSSAK
jgi:hypothetical protein